MDQRPWGREELRYCVANRGQLTCEQMAAHLGRTCNQVRKALQRWREKRRRAGIETVNLSRKWAKEELRFVEANRFRLSIHEMAATLKKTYHQVKGALRNLRERRQKVGACLKRKRFPLSHWIECSGAKIRRLHAQGYTDADLAKEIPGMSLNTANAVRRKMGLASNKGGERTRAKLRKIAKECMQFRVRSMIEAERLGWPGRSLAEAKTLSTLAESGPLTREELVARLGIKWGSGANSLCRRIHRLQGEGLVTNGDGRYRLAKGVERQAAYCEDDEDGS